MFYRGYETLNAGQSISGAVLRSTLAGLGGGVGFGLLMMGFAPNMLPGIGRLMGAEGYAGGWLYHLFISAVIGSIFGLVLGRVSSTYLFGLLWGLGYGFIWWVFGGLILFPLMLGALSRVLALGPSSWVSLLGHLIFGALTGLGTVWLSRRFQR